METLLNILVWALVIVGHLGLWCGVYNRIHATAWPRTHRKLSEKTILMIIALPMFWVLVILIYRWTTSLYSIFEVFRPAFWYGIWCLLFSWFYIFRWIYRKFTFKVPEQIGSHTNELLNLAARRGESLSAGGRAQLLAKLPFNQIELLNVEKFNLQFKRFPNSLNGLKICQLSDLHFTGQLKESYFAELVEITNSQSPDMIFITGDIIDHIECIDWIENTLGGLKAKHGVFYVLGNHDLRIKDEPLLRRKLEEQGFVNVGGKWHPVQIGEQTILLAGNELPWFRGAEDLEVIPPFEGHETCFKILLSHSPDQLRWAQQYGFDMMFAGHTHGGQIRFPLIGPVVAPSKFGVKYCSGTFDIEGMLMHVSRGISGDDPIRVNCPPELGVFEFCQARLDG